MNNPLVTINLVVRNGEKYIRSCLDSVRQQNYENYEVNIFDNASTDKTREIVKAQYPEFNLIEWKENLGLGKGQERCLEFSRGEFIVALCVDIILDKAFVRYGVETMLRDEKIGAVQSKMYRFNTDKTEIEKTDFIDSCGFKIFRSRRLINIGHGQQDIGQFNQEKEIFSFEGAAPFFRKKAMESSRIMGEIYDTDLFWYATDIDLGWKMRLLGWKSWYNPKMISWHDRPTTKTLKKNNFDFIKSRKEISKQRRRLSFRNYHLVLIKYDFSKNVIKDFIPFIKRELMLFVYYVMWEPWIFAEVPAFFKKLSRILKKRKQIMKLTQLKPEEIRWWFLE